MKKRIMFLSGTFFIIVCCIIFRTKYVYGKNNDIKVLLKKESVNTNQVNQFVMIDEYEHENNGVNKADKSIDFIKDIKANSNSIQVKNSNVSLDSNQVILLARLIESEAGCEPYYGKLAVASVVLNRISIDQEDMNTVIHKAGQFDGVKTSYFNIQPSNDSINAATETLRGNNVLPDSYFFANLKLCSPSFAKKDKFIVRIGDHWFFKK